VFFASGRNHPDLKDEVPGDQWITVSGIYWMELERFQRAKECCEKALELNSEYLPAAQLLEELKERN
jgi:hypothetical protein